MNDQMDVFVLMGERQSCEDEGDQMDVFVLMGERQSCEDEGDQMDVCVDGRKAEL